MDMFQVRATVIDSEKLEQDLGLNTSDDLPYEVKYDSGFALITAQDEWSDAYLELFDLLQERGILDSWEVLGPGEEAEVEEEYPEIHVKEYEIRNVKRLPSAQLEKEVNAYYDFLEVFGSGLFNDDARVYFNVLKGERNRRLDLDLTPVQYVVDSETDVDTSPRVIRVKCTTCPRIDELQVIGEDMPDYTLNDDGTYTSLYESCAQCLTQGDEEEDEYHDNTEARLFALEQHWLEQKALHRDDPMF